MVRLKKKFNYGTEIKDLNEPLYNQLNDGFYETSAAVNSKSTRMVQTANPPAIGQLNEGLDIGDIWVNSSTDTAWVMTSRKNLQTVTWKQIT